MMLQVARGLVVAALALSVSQAPSAPQPARLSVDQAIALYAQGQFATAVRDLDTRLLNVTPFTNALDAWIAAGDTTSRPRRRLVAATFALDAVWAVTRTPNNALRANFDPWKRVKPDDPEHVNLTWFVSQAFVARWAIQQLPTTGTPDATERALWLAAVGVVEDGHAWHQLQEDILPPARTRLSNEPRLRLAAVLARTNMDVGPLRLSMAIRNDILRTEHLPSSVTGRIPKAERELESLLGEASLAGEVELRVGYLELRRRQWASALTHLEAARSKATEPTLVAAADYFAGWVHEQQEHPDEAIAAYRRAQAITPTMRNLATRLSALLFLRNERAEAYAVLDSALNARPAPLDLLVAVERADGRFVPERLASIRKALQ